MSASVKFGVLGCAGIARKVCVAIAEAPNAECVAVASRSKDKAEAFAASNCPGARAYGSYDELLSDEDVQVVYVPLPTGMRAEWVLKAASKNKHILCEKPVGASMREIRSIVAACKQAGVQFMDNTMFMHHERLPAMRKVLDDTERFGVPSHVTTSFTLPFGNKEEWATGNIRMNRTSEPLGCLGDLGWYCVRFSLWAFQYENPESVSCQFLEETPDGVPVSVMALLKFPGGRTASFDCGFKQALQQQAKVIGTEAVLSLNDFVIASSNEEACFAVSCATLADMDITVAVKEDKETVTGPGCVQHTRLVEKLASIAASGELDDFWPTVALQTQMVVSALVKSARSGGAWITPREGAGGKAAGKGQREIVLKKAKFGNIGDLTPDAKGLNLQVKVVSVQASEDKACTAVVGDASGVVTLTLRSEGFIALVKEGASLIIRNGFVRMVKGHINLQVDRWGKVESSEESFAFEPKTTEDVSATEYELV